MKRYFLLILLLTLILLVGMPNVLAAPPCIQIGQATSSNGTTLPAGFFVNIACNSSGSWVIMVAPYVPDATDAAGAFTFVDGANDCALTCGSWFRTNTTAFGETGMSNPWISSAATQADITNGYANITLAPPPAAQYVVGATTATYNAMQQVVTWQYTTNRWMHWNYTGSPTVTTAATGGTYTFPTGQVAAGQTIYWRQNATGTGGGADNDAMPWQSFVVTRADPGLTVTSNATWSILEGEAVSISCTETATDAMTITLTGSVSSVQAYPYEYVPVAPGETWTCDSIQTQNYSVDTSNNNLVVTPAGLPTITYDVQIDDQASAGVDSSISITDFVGVKTNSNAGGALSVTNVVANSTPAYYISSVITETASGTTLTFSNYDGTVEDGKTIVMDYMSTLTGYDGGFYVDASSYTVGGSLVLSNSVGGCAQVYECDAWSGTNCTGAWTAIGAKSDAGTFPAIALTAGAAGRMFAIGTATGCDGGGGGGSCFPAGIKVLMADGNYENIENILVGDFVMSYDEVNNEFVEGEVLELEAPVSDHMCEISFKDGSSVEVTSEHAFYVMNSWIKRLFGAEGEWRSIDPIRTLRENRNLDVKKLGIGNKILSVDGVKIIDGINCWDEEVQTYNLKDVELYNNYVVEGMLVHNKGSSKYKNYYLSSKEVREGRVLGELREDDVIYFNVTTASVVDELHKLVITDVSNDFIRVEIYSDEQRETLYVGTETRFDVTGDGIKDVRISLNSIVSRVASLTIQGLWQPEEEEVEEVVEVIEEVPVEKKSNWWKWVVASVFLIAAGVIGWIYRSEIKAMFKSRKFYGARKKGLSEEGRIIRKTKKILRRGD